MSAENKYMCVLLENQICMFGKNCVIGLGHYVDFWHICTWRQESITNSISTMNGRVLISFISLSNPCARHFLEKSRKYGERNLFSVFYASGAPLDNLYMFFHLNISINLYTQKEHWQFTVPLRLLAGKLRKEEKHEALAEAFLSPTYGFHSQFPYPEPGHKIPWL